MHVTEVTDGIFRLSANAHNLLFEGIWPIPNGVSMNSYIVRGEKIAIVDGVCGWDGVPETLFEQFKHMDIHVDDIDYVIVNHHEPDHSGWLEDFKKIRPNFEIITSVRGEALLDAFYGITENIRTVKTGDTLDLAAAGGYLPLPTFPMFTGRKPWPPSIRRAAPSFPAMPSDPLVQLAMLPMMISWIRRKLIFLNGKLCGTIPTLLRPSVFR